MTSFNSVFQTPMPPWPPLIDYGKQLKLSELDLGLFFFEAGNNNHRNLIMVHGLGDEADTWRHVFLPLSEVFHTIAFDLPGFGRSEKPDVDLTPDYLINAILGFMDQLGIDSAIMMGSSLGGILAHGLALTCPERVPGLILVGGALLQAEQMQDWSIRLMSLPIIGEWLYTRLRKDPEAAFESLKNVYHQLDELPESDRAFLFTRVNQRVWSDGQRRAYFSTLRKLTPWLRDQQADLPAQLRELMTPTLVIRGEFDPLFPEANALAIINNQPNATRATIKGAGHLPQQEDPETFLESVQLWLHQNC
jgi:pimeloyl-ACP methyl ester carboxylesterase